MHFQLHRNLSYCVADGRVVFLDIERDLYFRLPDDLEPAFLSSMAGEGVSDSEANKLIESNIITVAAELPKFGNENPMTHPLHSALEREAVPVAVTTTLMLDVFSIVCWTWLKLATRNLHDVLTELAAYRARKAPREPDMRSAPEVDRLSEAAIAFRRARHYVPIETRCLLDSLSLARFLAKRGLHANVVLGVMGNPFSAHCWVQAGHLALNETVGDADAFTPIRTI